MPQKAHMDHVSAAMLPSRVLESVTRSEMLRAGDRVLVALSGGADSVALTEILVELAERFHPPLSLVVAHLNHGLRADADVDVEFCRSLARRHSLPFTTERIDVGALALGAKRSVEDEGRRVRYRFLDDEAIRWGCQRVALGHTLDDQAETFLLRLLRGSGGRGLGAVYPVVEPRLIRPLLGVRRAEIEAYLRARGAPHREDPSNADRRFTRNRLRHETLPRLRREFNPRLVETLSKSASLFRDEEDWMERETERVFDALVGRAEKERGIVRFDVRALREHHPALQRRLVRRAIEVLRGDLANVGHVHVECVRELLADGKSGREIHLPGLEAERSFSELRIRRIEGAGGSRRQNARERGYNGFEYRLSIPARVWIPERSGVVSARLASEGREERGAAGGSHSRPAAVGDAVVLGFEPGVVEDSRMSMELEVRSPRPGDRFRPLGAPGSKSLMRYLMDRKVDRHERTRVPLVVRRRADDHETETEADGSSASQEILWVVGHGVSESCRMAPGRRLVSLTWEPLEPREATI